MACKVLTIIGARPQFIKAAAVSWQMADAGIHEMLVHTGQHFDKNMSDVFFHELGIREPTINLGIGGGSHGQNTGRMIEAIEDVLNEKKPDVVTVYGDTDSTLAGALAAAKLHIPVAHVEAGLRSFNRRMPEEINRVLTDHASSLLFAPTELAVNHLADEGIEGDAVRLVGDVMYDATLRFAEKSERISGALEQVGCQPRQYILATVHRAENTDDPVRLKAILDGLAGVVLPVVLPLHPRTKRRLQSLGMEPAAAIHVVEPLGFLDMVMLEKNAALIATDSGGVQKEAFFHRVPCVTLRDETEWSELIDAGWNHLAPPSDAATVTRSITEALGSAGEEISPYGNGNAATMIAQDLLRLCDNQ